MQSADRNKFSLDCWIWEEATEERGRRLLRGFIVRFSSGKLRITIIWEDASLESESIQPQVENSSKHEMRL